MRTLSSRIRSFLRIAVLLSVLSTLVVVQANTASADPASGGISGTVFRDFGTDGTLDSVDGLEAGIEVRAFDDEGNSVGPVFSGDDGTYSLDLTGLTATTNDEYRVEFTIPTAATGYLRAGQLGSDNGGPVQFAAAGASDVHFAVTNPAQYCDNDPELAVTCWVNGQQDGDTDDGPVDSDGFDALVTLPWSGHSSSSDLTLPTNPAKVADNGQIGTTWGVAYQRATQSLFVGAAQRRHTGFGPGGTGMIYKMNADGSGYSQFLDVNAIAGVNTGADPHTGLPFETWVQSNPAASASYDAASFDAVGKIGLGDLDLSEDEETLWAINANDRTLLEVPIGANGTAPDASDITVHDVGGAVSCSNGVFRPFALAVRDGQTYAGGVCTGETGGAIGDVAAHILRHDPNGPDGNFTSVYTLPMNYRATVRPADAECAFILSGTGIGCDGWRAWRSSWADISPAEIILGPDHRFYAAPQPMLTDIEIDSDGSIVLAFADRFGLQSGFRNYDDSGTNTALHSGTTAGDLIRLCNVDGTLTFPCNPTGVEHYVGDNAPGGSDLHPESGWGGTAMHFASGEVAMTIADPINVWSGGIGWFDKFTGLISTNSPAGTLRRYEVFLGGSNSTSAAATNQTGIGKASGLGDLEILCDAAPIEIGNRVWFDRNGNGRQDPSEPVLPGVGVRLLDAGGSELATTTTDANGVYSFNSIDTPTLTPLTSFTVEFDESTADVSGIDELADVSILEPTLTDAAAADDNDDSDIDSNRQIDVTTGGAGATNFTLDAGFRGGLQIGDLVWFDLNNNGDADDGEPILAGLKLELYRETGVAGFDGSEELVASTVSNGEGIYFFRQIIDGESYYIAVPNDQSSTTITLDGETIDELSLLSSTGTATNPIDNNDDGSPLGNFIATTDAIVVSDTPASEPTGETDAPPDPDTDSEEVVFEETSHQIDDDDSNLTVDLGFVQKLRIGNLIWLDGRFGETGFNNGIADSAEALLGLGGVTIELYLDDDGTSGLDAAADTFVADTTTDPAGNYLFANLDPDTYILAIPAGQTGQTLDGETVDLDDHLASTPISAANGAIDDRNDGATIPDFIAASSPFELDFNDRPTNEGGDFGVVTDNAAEAVANAAATGFVFDSFSDLSLDFSFITEPLFSIGNLVWLDENDNGIAEPGEPGIGGVGVQLFEEGETSSFATTTTGTDGKYLFDDLPAGNYFVRVAKTQTGQTIGANTVNLSVLLTSSVSESNTDSDTDNDNNGIMVGDNLDSGVLKVGNPNPLAPTEPTNETLRSGSATDDDASSVDAASNLTVDIGFVMPVRVGNIVWLDDGGGEPGDPSYDAADENDGEADATEAGIEGVLVQLLDEDDEVVGETVTDADGRYVFDGLRQGDFRIAIPTDQTPVLELTLSPDQTALDDRRSSDGVSTNPEAADDDDDGQSAEGFVAITATFNLDHESEAADEAGNFGDPTEDGAEDDVNDDFDPLPDNNSNLAIDLGLANVPSFSVGNLIWEDFDNDGIAEAGEPGIEGVLVQLLDDEGVVVAETVTNGDGQYSFDNVEVGDYQVNIPDNQSPVLGAQPTILPGALAGLEPSENLKADPDSPSSIDNDSNGVHNEGNPSTPDITSGVLSIGEGDTHSEPTGETLRANDATSDEPTTQRADRNDFTVDFGFWRGLRVGNQVWLDGVQGEAGYDNGVIDVGEIGLGGITVQLWIDTDEDGDAEPDGDDGIAPVQQLTTDDEGNYLFIGLDEDVPYFVVIPDVPAGFSSTGASSDPIADGDNDDDGAPNADRVIVSKIFTLSIGDASTGETDAGPGEDAEAEANAAHATIPDGNSELRIDFGFIEIPIYRIGNLIFDDTNGNGMADSDEAGIAGVLVQLTDTDGDVIAETTTTEAGVYSFDGLVAGTYSVRVPFDQAPILGAQPNLDPTALDGYTSPTVGEEAQPNDDVDSNDNGIEEVAAWKSGPVQLGPDFVADSIAPPFGTEPENEADPFTGNDDDPNGGDPTSFPDDQSNLTIDFGFVRLALGNQVWFDTNGDGLLSAGEPGLNGVAVNLLKVDGSTGALNLVDTTVTANDGTDDGIYLFTGLAADMEYVVEIPASQFAVDGPLAGMFSSPDPAGEPVDPNLGGIDDDGLDGDDNGQDQSDPIRSLPVLIKPATEPTTADPVTGPSVADGNENLTVDFGFTGLAIGNIVWLDEDEDGTRDETEPGIAHVQLELWAVDETGNPINDEPSGVTVTNENGTFLFTGLEPGEFMIVMPSQNFDPDAPLRGLTSSTGNGIVAPEVDADPTDDDDNGNIDSSGQTISSAPFTLTYGDEPTGETDELSSFDPKNTNLTIDFGMISTPPMSIGNRVWFDIDNSGTLDEDELGIADVVVELWTADEDGVLAASTTTDDDGYYLFADIEPDEYVVVIPASNFEDGATLERFHPSTGGDVTDPDDNLDGDNEGGVPSELGEAVASMAVAVVPSLEPSETDLGPNGHGTTVDEAITDENSNLTIDFGFVAMSIGNRVWFDEDNSGTINDDEAGIAGVTVNLFDQDGTLLTTETTDADGYYLFTGIAPGEYKVGIPASEFADDGPLAGMHSSTGNGSAPDPDADESDGDDNGDADVDGNVIVANLTLEPGSEPTEEADASIDHNDPSDEHANLTIDLGFYTATLITTIGIDSDGNGKLDGNEPRRAGVEVEILDADGNVVATTISGPNGVIIVTGLAEGSMRIRLMAKNFETGGALDDVILSKDDLNNGVLSDPIEIKAGETEVELARVLGQTLIPEATIGDTVWNDDDGDGIQDANETGAPEVTVILLDSGGIEISRTLTDAEGSYEFEDLQPDTYTIEVLKPSDKSYSPADQGDDDTLDSDVDTETGKSGPVIMSIGEANDGVDAGLSPNLGTVPDLLAFSGSTTTTIVVFGLALLLAGGTVFAATNRRRLASFSRQG